MSASPLLSLPRELRDRVYENLLSTKHTKTPKEAKEGCRSAVARYNWNLDPTTLRVNRQIRAEGRRILALNNQFVVIERDAEQLVQKKDDVEEENTTIMRYAVRIWPRKGCKEVDVPGERMRIWLGCKERQGVEGEKYVILVEELRDLCVALSTFVDHDGGYRLCDIYARVTLGGSRTGVETSEAKAERATSLLQPLAKLRYLKDIKIEDVAPDSEEEYRRLVTRQGFEEDLVTTTINDLIQDGDHACDIGHFDVATAYYQRASEYFHHMAEHQRDAFGHPADPLAIEFRIMQHRALSWIEDDNFEDAYEVSKIALQVANQLFLVNSPSTAGPPKTRGRVQKGAYRHWTCQCIKEGAERYEQRIKCEDIGRCYYYKSIAELIVYGDESAGLAEEDKLTGIGCCIVSDTATEEENVPRELLELDARTMGRLDAREGSDADADDQGEDEWEDEDEDHE